MLFYEERVDWFKLKTFAFETCFSNIIYKQYYTHHMTFSNYTFNSRSLCLQQNIYSKYVGLVCF